LGVITEGSDSDDDFIIQYVILPHDNVASVFADLYGKEKNTYNKSSADNPCLDIKLSVSKSSYLDNELPGSNSYFVYISDYVVTQ